MHLPPTTLIATERSELGGKSPRESEGRKGRKSGEERSAASALPRQVFHLSENLLPDIYAHPTHDARPFGESREPDPRQEANAQPGAADTRAWKARLPRVPRRRDLPGVPCPGRPGRPSAPAAPTAAAPAVTMGGSFSRSGSFPFLSSEAAAATAGSAPGEGGRCCTDLG